MYQNNDMISCIVDLLIYFGSLCYKVIARSIIRFLEAHKSNISS